MISVIATILMAIFFNKKPERNEVLKMLEKEARKHPDESPNYKIQIYLKANSRGVEEPICVSKTVYWDLKFKKIILPMGAVLLAGFLFAIDPFFH